MIIDATLLTTTMKKVGLPAQKSILSRSKTLTPEALAKNISDALHKKRNSGAFSGVDFISTDVSKVTAELFSPSPLSVDPKHVITFSAKPGVSKQGAETLEISVQRPERSSDMFIMGLNTSLTLTKTDKAKDVWHVTDIKHIDENGYPVKPARGRKNALHCALPFLYQGLQAN